MSYNRKSCYGTSGATGYSQLCEDSISAIRKFIVVPTGTSIATETLALTESTWTNLRKAAVNSRGYFLPLANTFTPEVSEDKVVDTALAGKKFVSEGRISMKQMLDLPLYLHQELKKFNSQKWAVYCVMDNGNIIGTSSDGIKFEPFTCENFRVGVKNFSDGATLSETPISVTLRDTAEWDLRGVELSPTFDLLNTDGLYNLYFTVTNPATTGFTLDVKLDGTDKGLAGLVKADFIVKDAGGSVKTITTVTDNGGGNYTFAMTLSAGATTIQTVAAGSLSLTTIAAETPTRNIGTFTVPS